MYFETDKSEFCYPKSHFKKGQTVFKAIPINNDFMFCKTFQSVGEKGNCGMKCAYYKPKNGKSGMCVNTGKVYEVGEKTII
ncbi:hypothetical protein V6O07_05680 [Arthrospira platensis SPKY2]